MAARLRARRNVWAVCAARPDGPHHLITRLVLTAGRRPPWFTERVWRYPDLLLVETALSGREADGLISGTPTRLGGTLCLLQAQEDGHWRRFESKAGPDDPPWPWPMWRGQFSAASRDHTPTESGPLVGVSVPSFLTEEDAHDAFFHGSKTSRPSRHEDVLVVRIVDARAYIDRIVFKPTSVAVRVLGRGVRGCRLELVSHDGSQETILDGSGLTEFVLGGQPPDEWWVVLSRDGELLDSRSYGPFSRPRDLERAYDPREQVEALLAGGEGLTVEFKERLPEPAMPARATTMLKTVVAFANTEGGTILFGVDDNAGVVGVAEPFDVARDRLVSMIRARIAPLPRIHIAEVTHGNLRVLALRVDAPGRRGYSLDDPPTFYLRRGASSLPAGRDDIARLLATQERSELGWR